MKADNYIKHYAIICFRDVADENYILARLAFKNTLVHEFWWNAQQCIEKLFKCILLLNKIKVKNINHDLNEALKLINRKCKYVTLSENTKLFIKTVNDMGSAGSRYPPVSG